MKARRRILRDTSFLLEAWDTSSRRAYGTTRDCGRLAYRRHWGKARNGPVRGSAPPGDDPGRRDRHDDRLLADPAPARRPSADDAGRPERGQQRGVPGAPDPARARRSAAGPVPEVGHPGAAGRPRPLAAQPAPDRRGDRLARLPDPGAGRAGDAARAADRGAGRRRLGPQAGLGGRRLRHVRGPQRRRDPPFLPRNPAHLRLRGVAEGRAALRLRPALGGPRPEPQAHADAGPDARLGPVRGADAPDPLGPDRGDAAGVHRDRPRQGAGRDGRRGRPRLQERPDTGRDHPRTAGRHADRRRGPERDDLLDPRDGAPDRRLDLLPRLPDRPGGRADPRHLGPLRQPVDRPRLRLRRPADSARPVSAVARPRALAEPITGHRRSDFLHLLFSARLAWLGVLVLLTMLFLAATADVLTPYDPNYQDYAHTLEAPGSDHPFGPDQLGRDV